MLAYNTYWIIQLYCCNDITDTLYFLLATRHEIYTCLPIRFVYKTTFHSESLTLTTHSKCFFFKT